MGTFECRDLAYFYPYFPQTLSLNRFLYHIFKICHQIDIFIEFKFCSCRLYIHVTHNLNLCQGKSNEDILCFVYLKWIVLIMVSSWKLIAAKYSRSKEGNECFAEKKTQYCFPFLLRWRIKGYRCESNNLPVEFKIKVKLKSSIQLIFRILTQT